MTCFSEMDFFFTNLRPENNRAGANTGFWRFSSKIGVIGFNMIQFNPKNCHWEKKIKKKCFFWPNRLRPT